MQNIGGCGLQEKCGLSGCKRNCGLQQSSVGCCKVLGMPASVISRWSNKSTSSTVPSTWQLAKWNFPGGCPPVYNGHYRQANLYQCKCHGTWPTGWYTQQAGGHLIQVAFHNKCIVAVRDIQEGVFIQRNGTIEWNGGMERWNGMEWNSGMTTPTERVP